MRSQSAPEQQLNSFRVKSLTTKASSYDDARSSSHVSVSTSKTHSYDSASQFEGEGPEPSSRLTDVEASMAEHQGTADRMKPPTRPLERRALSPFSESAQSGVIEKPPPDSKPSALDKVQQLPKISSGVAAEPTGRETSKSGGVAAGGCAASPDAAKGENSRCVTQFFQF